MKKKQQRTEKPKPKLKARGRPAGGKRKTQARPAPRAVSWAADRLLPVLNAGASRVGDVTGRIGQWIADRGGFTLLAVPLLAVVAIVPVQATVARQLLLVIGGLVLFGMAWNRRFSVNQYTFLDQPLDLFALTLVLAYIVALPGAASTRLAVGGSLNLVLFFVTYWVVSRIARTPSQRESVMWILVLGAVGLVVLALVGYPLEVGATAVILVSGAVLSVAMGARNPSRVASGAAYTALFGLVLSGSLPALLTAPLVLAVLALLTPTTIRGALARSAIAPVAGALAAVTVLHLGSSPLLAYLSGITSTLVLFALASHYEAENGRRIWYIAPALLLWMSLAYPLIRPGADVATNLLIRFGDAWRMFIDRPFLGAGGGAWTALIPGYRSFLYVVPEAPNQMLTVALEAGLLGLTVFAGLWVVVARTGLKARRLTGSESPAGAGILSVLAGVLVLSLAYTTLAHPSSGLYFWIALGILGAQARRAPAQTRVDRFDYRLLPRLAVYGTTMAVLLAAVTLAAGAVQGQGGMRYLDEGRVGDAEAALSNAVQYDALSGEFMSGLASAKYRIGIALESPEILGQAAHWFARATVAEPLNPSYHLAYARFAADVGWEEEARSSFEMAVDLDPTNYRRYDDLAMFLSLAAQREKGWGDPDLVEDYLDRSRDVARDLAAMAESVPAHLPPEQRLPASTPVINLSLGQILALTGSLDEAETSLWLAAGDEDPTRPQALLWLAVLRELRGDFTGAGEILEPLLEERPELESGYHTVRFLLDLEIEE